MVEGAADGAEDGAEDGVEDDLSFWLDVESVLCYVVKRNGSTDAYAGAGSARWRDLRLGRGVRMKQFNRGRRRLAARGGHGDSVAAERLWWWLGGGQ